MKRCGGGSVVYVHREIRLARPTLARSLYTAGHREPGCRAGGDQMCVLYSMSIGRDLHELC